MFDELLTKIFGSRNDRLIKQYRRKCDAINKLEPAMQALSDEELKAKTQEFRDRIAKGATTDELLPEAFAVVREASVRVLGMRHFDVQLIGAMVLNDGKIAEMRTGEGKTLTATLAVYLNALPGKGCHVVTVNDYLASRDADWMGRLYNWLGLSVGKILSNQNNEEKRAAYASDITYGTNNEFGFDYLRDNMEYDVAARRQRPLYYAIVDEVDSILIDEARTPLIISGPADDNTELYRAVNDIPPLLTRQAEEKGEGDYWVDEKAHQVYLSEAGHEHLEQILSERGLVQQGESLYAPKNIILMHHLNAALRAHTLFHRDQHYVVQNGEIVIVDEFTGRLMPGRRWSEGLHQAVEAKEGVKIQQENQTMASITFQNFFRMYGKLSGMTGTADTEAYEFQDIYGLETVVVPTHRKMVRIDEQDKVYRTVNEKYRAIIDDVKACYERRQPVLLGTTSIENSELLSSMLTKEGIPHNVLNAKQHDREAQIVLEAGRPGVVTIATNMAGRGTDIVLGGGINKAVDAIRADETLTEEQREAKIAEVKAEWQKLHDIVVEAGGLRIIGSERHESRRIDNQLRGRAGRQGDPGSSCFYLSMEDQLLRIFGGDRMRAIADKLRLEEGEAIESKMLTRMIESAQRKVEGRNYDIRKQLLEFDDVQNDQRHEIYGLRNQILESEDISELVKNLREGLFTDLFRAYVPAETVEEQWDLDGLQTKLAGEFGIVIDFKQLLDSNDQFTDDDLLEALLKQAEAQYVEKEQMVGHEAFTGFARSLLLQILDQLWRQHISALEALRQGIYLRGYAQKQPKQEYKREAFNMFEQLLDQIRETLVRVLMQVQINVKPAEEPAQQQPVEEPAPAEATGSALENMPKEELDPALFAHVGRNDPCPCGSGRRFKDCHGRLS
ncbi:preprotein translocase, SecA subunit [Sutterella wadsworthensis 2_1_59BFAA]|jgi:preprotein translocase, secA subunit|uniref:Protein translocase subunit SecA n=1 Tax=Sutterella wadsworthensis 2_1_59BFAA TaxID=742823 RepID=K1JKB7_9BURK|nr:MULTISPECIES: preprotein translocase subunit SecA [Sutterella]EKB30631.1 preprotein translocase, SecA subunit [Sutterella wadsworthensis 2_1_59BFAA]KXT31700.1 preprotein translocase, SecA subunit [Sutterella sp. KLE1602]MBD9117027.1 preprotein translocase subunit SecA [Sutterella sp.]MBS6615689.1 preprotein translocase subunit SecA [Sutterella wadsworthensis]